MAAPLQEATWPLPLSHAHTGQSAATAILRGIRNTTDLHAECQLAITNRQVADIESVFVVPGEAFAYTSSSLASAGQRII